MAVNFPTSASETRPKRAGKISNVRTGYNPNYGPDGKNGLYLNVEFRSGRTSDFFFPAPPNTKTQMLLEALERLGIAPKQLGGEWEDLIGYNLEWETINVPVSFKEKSSGDEVKRLVQCDVPSAIIGRPGEASVAADEPVAATEGADFDEVCRVTLEMAEGRTQRGLGWALEKDERIAGNSKRLAIVNSGAAVTALIEAGSLAIVEGKYVSL